MENDYTIEKRHSSILTEVFPSKSAYDKHEAQCAEYKPQFEKLLEILKAKVPFVYGKFGTFCPYLQFVRLDMLDKKDWPHGISDNSVFLEFELNMAKNTVEIHNYGFINLTDEDQKKSRLYMCGMKDAHKVQGGKWFRKTKYKSIEEATEKIVKFYNSVYKSAETATGGYPFKKMKINIY